MSELDLKPKDTLLDKAISVGLWGVGLAWLLPMMTSMRVLYNFSPSWKSDWLTRLYCGTQVRLTGSTWEAVVHPDVDINQQYIFAQNHVNHFDHVTMYNSTQHYKQGLELETHFKYPFYGPFMKARGTIPVRKDAKGQTGDILRHMRSEIDAGRSILAFPEGGRTMDGRVGPFRRGIFFLARDLGVPIIPTSVTGMYEVMYKGSLVIRPGKHITVYCDKPEPTKGLTDEEIPALADRVRAAMVKRVDDYWRARGFNIPT